MLVPEVASGAASELDDLRTACGTAVRHLLNANPRSLLVIGSGLSVTLSSATMRHDPVTASFAPFGVSLDVTLTRATAVAPQPLPASLLVAAWLLREMDAAVDICLRSVAADLPPQRCARWRPEPDDQLSEQPWGLLVMGDGSACRTQKAPGYLDPRAEAFDETVAAALAAVDTDTLLALDPTLAADLWCAGRAPWQVLAGLVAADGGPWTGEVLYNECPEGVTYLVATLAPAVPAAGRRPALR